MKTQDYNPHDLGTPEVPGYKMTNVNTQRMGDEGREKEVSICCEMQRSIIYPRDCPHCGGLFIPKEINVIGSIYDRKFMKHLPKFVQEMLVMKHKLKLKNIK